MEDMSHYGYTSTTSRPRKIDFPAVRREREKEKAIARLQEYNIAEILENLLNKACKLKPDDLYGYMSEHFHSLAKEPVISSLSVFEGIDSNGKKSVEIDLYCTICGVNKLISRSSLSVDPYNTVVQEAPSTPRKGSGKKHKAGSPRSPCHSPVAEAKPIGVSVERKVNFMDTVRTEISKALKGLPVKQYQVDQVLEDIRLKAAGDKVILDPISLLTVSCAVAQAGSRLSSHPLFLCLSSSQIHSHADSPPTSALNPSLTVDPCPMEEPSEGLRSPSRNMSLFLPVPPPPSHPPQKYSMPLPVVAMLGQSTGKLKVREFCVCPLPGPPVPQQIKMLERLYHEIGKIITSKLGAASRVTLPNGAYSPALDKFDQALDLFKEATHNAGFHFNTDVGILIDVGADSLYDEDKGKYEMGGWKTTEELISMYSDLIINANSGVLGFIDPLHPKDLAGWKKIITKLGSKCLIIADSTLQKGQLPLVMQTRETLGSPRLSPRDDSGGGGKVEGEREGRVEGEGEDVCAGVEGLPCAALTWENSLSSTMDKVDHLKGCSRYVMMSSPHNLTMNTIMADLAVASHCKFIRLGSPIGMVTLLLNRLLGIHEEMLNRKILEIDQAILFGSDCQH